MTGGLNSQQNDRRSAIDAARVVLRQAIDDKVFPAAAVEVGDATGPLWREPFGQLTFEPDAQPAGDDTIFDLASLTKPMATASLAMQLLSSGAFSLDDPLGSYFPEWRGGDREAATIRDLLEHSTGLSARLVDQPPESRREFEYEICRLRLEYRPGERSVYSDLGFILLAFLLEDRGSASLATQFDRLMVRLAALRSPEGKPDTSEAGLTFVVPPDARARTAPTWPMDEDRRRGRILKGEVHDNYAAALGGAAGHAGLFGTATAVGSFARLMLRSARGDESVSGPLSPSVVTRMIRKSHVPGSSRALGWDTMLPTSSCGSLLSPVAFGHTGFTGTSVWVDPVLNRYFVLLTNRAYHGGTTDDMQRVRRRFHEALAALD